jgi:hypothetical protein
VFSRQVGGGAAEAAAKFQDTHPRTQIEQGAGCLQRLDLARALEAAAIHPLGAEDVVAGISIVREPQLVQRPRRFRALSVSLLGSSTGSSAMRLLSAVANQCGVALCLLEPERAA